MRFMDVSAQRYVSMVPNRWSGLDKKSILICLPEYQASEMLYKVKGRFHMREP